MEPNKLENQIREKLHSREIQPSAQAWNRLDAMLSEAEEKKTRRPFGFLFIAASITILLTVGMLFFTQNGPEIQTIEEVVGTEVEKDSVVKIPNSKFQIPKIEGNQTVVSNQPTTDNRQPTTNNQRVSISNQKNDQSRSFGTNINREKEIEYMIGEAIGIKDLPQIDSSTKIFIPKKSNSKKSTYIDVDELLSSVDNSNSPKAKTNIDKIKVDATALLFNADNEVETSFREKVINRVSKNYKEVKVALSTRNQE